jgi:DNA-binding NarL/FixJ family response regulator
MAGSHVLHPLARMDSLVEEGERIACLRILIADDNIEILNHVSGMLVPEHTVVRKVSDGNQVCFNVATCKPDLVILDISMGVHSGIEIARRLREQGYTGEVIFLTVHEDPDFITAAIGAGARGYVTKSQMNGDLKLAIKAVLSHQVFISPPMR